MKTTTLATAVIIAAVLGTTTVASATPPRARQVNQSTRITRGVVNGRLTVAETAVLAVEQHRIANTRRRYLANDGRLGPAERARLNRMQNRSSRHIWTLKHNRRGRR